MGDVICATMFFVGLYAFARWISHEYVDAKQVKTDKQDNWYQITDAQRN